MLSGLKLLPHHEQIKHESGLSESASLIIRLLLMGIRKLISHATYIEMAGEGQGIFIKNLYTHRKLDKHSIINFPV